MPETHCDDQQNDCSVDQNEVIKKARRISDPAVSPSQPQTSETGLGGVSMLESTDTRTSADEADSPPSLKCKNQSSAESSTLSNTPVADQEPAGSVDKPVQADKVPPDPTSDPVDSKPQSTGTQDQSEAAVPAKNNEAVVPRRNNEDPSTNSVVSSETQQPPSVEKQKGVSAENPQLGSTSVISTKNGTTSSSAASSHSSTDNSSPNPPMKVQKEQPKKPDDVQIESLQPPDAEPPDSENAASPPENANDNCPQQQASNSLKHSDDHKGAKKQGTGPKAAKNKNKHHPSGQQKAQTSTDSQKKNQSSTANVRAVATGASGVNTVHMVA